jgi:hypothetical protein
MTARSIPLLSIKCNSDVPRNGHAFFRRHAAMNIPLPPMSCGQIVNELPAPKMLPFARNSGSANGSKSDCVALKCSTTPEDSARVNVQTE